MLAAAGTIAGIGGLRPNLGRGNNGQFIVLNDDDPEMAEFEFIKRAGARAVQDEALANPIPYDDDTSELLSWYLTESPKRTACRETTTKSSQQTEKRKRGRPRKVKV